MWACRMRIPYHKHMLGVWEGRPVFVLPGDRYAMHGRVGKGADGEVQGPVGDMLAALCGPTLCSALPLSQGLARRL